MTREREVLISYLAREGEGLRGYMTTKGGLSERLYNEGGDGLRGYMTREGKV